MQYVCVCRKVCTGGRQSVMLGILLCYYPILFLRQDIFLNLELIIQLDWLASKCQGAISLHSLRAAITHACCLPCFCMLETYTWVPMFSQEELYPLIYLLGPIFNAFVFTEMHSYR